MRASDAFNRSLIDSTADCIQVLDLQGKLLDLPHGPRVLGSDCHEGVLNTLWRDFWTGEDRQSAQAAIQAAAAGGMQRFVGLLATPGNATR